MEMRAIIQGGSTIASLGERILGRTTLEDVVDKDGNVIAPVGTLLDEPTTQRIEDAEVQSVKIRSPLVCEATLGVCGQCYGRDLARGPPVNIGEAVVVIAATSIGEPGTQLTIRTFQLGGAAQVNEQSNAEAISDGTIEYRDMATIVDQRGRRLALSRSGELAIIDSEGRERASHKLPYGAQILHKDGEKVKRSEEHTSELQSLMRISSAVFCLKK